MSATCTRLKDQVSHSQKKYMNIIIDLLDSNEGDSMCIMQFLCVFTECPKHRGPFCMVLIVFEFLAAKNETRTDNVSSLIILC